MTGPDFDPSSYWSERLEGEFSLKGTGHIAYSEPYNRWLYRAKRRAFRRALSAVSLPAKALDIGSGTGWVIAELAKFGAVVEGSDLTSVAVANLRSAFPGVEFQELAIGRDPIPHADASLDLVTALDVLYHVPDDSEWESALREIARVLRPGGILIVSDGMLDRDERPAAHVHFRGRARWQEEANRAGLELTTVLPLYRWLSRDQSDGRLAKLPDRVRGPIEYGLERLGIGQPHMHCAVLTRTA